MRLRCDGRMGDLGVYDDGSVRYRLMVLWMYHNSPLLCHFRFHCSTRPAKDDEGEKGSPSDKLPQQTTYDTGI